MKVLIVKTSSLGDVIHTLPALTDALHAYPDLEVDWLVEKNFSEPLRWHKGVKRIIEIEFRKWRKTPWQTWRQGHWQAMYRQLRENRYDIIIDAQGLLKSALMAFLAKGKRHGLAVGSSRESFAPWLYHHRHVIAWEVHAIERVRQLFAKTLGYPVPSSVADYGLQDFFNPYLSMQTRQYIIFLHGTTWDTKLWPLSEWQALGQKLNQAGYQIRLPWGNAIEKERAEMIAKACNGQVLPALSLREIAVELINAKAVVAVDTGLGHLAAALSVPTISLYGATDAQKTGTRGRNQQHLSVQYHCAPCFKQQCLWVKEDETPPCYATLAASRVLQTVQPVLQEKLL
jgi:heptosyltransferase-1